jgi:hypothetical protein
MKKYMTIVHAKNQIFILNSAELLFTKNSSADVGIKLYNKLPNTIKRLDKIQEFKRRLKFFSLQHIFYCGQIYVLLGSTATQLFIIMYTLFLVFSNSTKQGT